jgi:chromosome condensin MukBEF complex kleisin-like MukF subunit
VFLPTERQIVYVDIRSLGEAGGVALERASPITVTICDHYTRTRYQQEFKISF